MNQNQLWSAWSVLSRGGLPMQLQPRNSLISSNITKYLARTTSDLLEIMPGDSPPSGSGTTS
jgi:hypothetical protein